MSRTPVSPAHVPVRANAAESDPPEDAGAGRLHRTIRSFVRRDGRITPAQARGLEHGWPRFGLESDRQLDLDQVFGRRAQRVLEIGFGMGDALLHMAGHHPERDYIGLEVYDPGHGRVLGRLMAEGLTNVRLLRGDAAELLPRCIAPESLSVVALFFPDPWPKKRHRKRRLVQPPFVSMVASRLEPGGTFQLATDWADYAEHMMEVLEAHPQFENVAGHGAAVPRPAARPLTKFERRGERLGNAIVDLEFRRTAAQPKPSDNHACRSKR